MKNTTIILFKTILRFNGHANKNCEQQQLNCTN